MATAVMASKAPKVRRATRGPFTATLVCCTGNNGIDPAAYKFRVNGMDGEHTISKRYSHFATLRESLSASSFANGAELPTLPPKSFFRKNFSPEFMSQRAACLCGFLQAVLEIDRLAAANALGNFLGVGKSSSKQQGLKAVAVPAPKDQKILSWVPEAMSWQERSDSNWISSARSENASNGNEQAGLSEKAGPEASVEKPSPSKPQVDKHSLSEPCRLPRARSRMCLPSRT